MNKKNNGMMKNALYYVLVILAMVMVVYFIFGNNSQQSSDIEYSKFAEQLEDGKIKEFTFNLRMAFIKSPVNIKNANSK
jgi:cell division protease FtsH